MPRTRPAPSSGRLDISLCGALGSSIARLTYAARRISARGIVITRGLGRAEWTSSSSAAAGRRAEEIPVAVTWPSLLRANLSPSLVIRIENFAAAAAADVVVARCIIYRSPRATYEKLTSLDKNRAVVCMCARARGEK